MSDDDFLCDEDDYLCFDDFPYIEAVCLIQATMSTHGTFLPR